MMLSILNSIFSLVLNMLKNNSSIFEGLKLLLIGLFFELNRRLSSWFIHTISTNIIATARISESDESFDWIYHYLTTQTHSNDLIDDDVNLEDNAKRSFIGNLLNSIVPFSKSTPIPMDVQILLRQSKNHSYHSLSKHPSVQQVFESKFGKLTKSNGINDYRVDVIPSLGKVQKIKFKGKTIKIGMTKDDNSMYENSKWIVMQAYFSTPQIFNSLIKQAGEKYLSLSINKTLIYTPQYGRNVSWTRTSTKINRPWESIFLNESLKQWILDDAKGFLEQKDFYLKRGIPYRRGYLCFGVAGSGKSSLIGALAAKLNLNIYLINLGGKNLDDDNLQSLLQACPGRCLVLMEDIDCAFTTKMPDTATEDSDSNLSVIESPVDNTKKGTKSTRQSEKLITLSGLLNALDGVASSEGRLLFCTTNWKEKIDPALSRPGRCDVWIEFKHATREQAQSLFEYFYKTDHGDDVVPELSKEERDPESSKKNNAGGGLRSAELGLMASKFASNIPEDTISVSALQGFLMRYKNQPQSAVEHVENWVKDGFSQGPTPVLYDDRVEMRVMGEQDKGE